MVVVVVVVAGVDDVGSRDRFNVRRCNNGACAAARDAERLDARSREVKSHKARADTVLYVKPFGM